MNEVNEVVNALEQAGEAQLTEEQAELSKVRATVKKLIEAGVKPKEIRKMMRTFTMPGVEEAHVQALRVEAAMKERVRKNAIRLRNHQRSEAGKAK